MSENETIKDIVTEYLKNHKACGLKQYFENCKKELYDYIMAYTSILSDKYPFSHRLYWVVNNIKQFPTCILCGKPNMRVITYNDGYSGNKAYCSHKCVTRSNECVNKRKSTNLQRYGVDCPAKREEIKEKIKNTCISKYGTTSYLNSEEGKRNITNIIQERYGVDHISKSEERKKIMRDIWSNRDDKTIQEIVSKSRNTKQERYGDENYSNRDLARKTNQERYGCDHYMKTSEGKERVKATNLEKYGVEYGLQSPEIRKKIIATNNERYGCDYYTSTEEFREKVVETNLEKYGVEYCLQSPEIRKKIEDTTLNRYGVSNVAKHDSPLRKMIDQSNRDKYNGVMFTQTSDFIDKVRHTNQVRYGKDWALQNDIVRRKIKDTMISRYGVDNIFKSEHFKEKNRINSLIKTYNRLLTNKSIIPQFTLDEFLNNPFDVKFKWKCLHCGNIIESPRSSTLRCEDTLYVRCDKCYPKYGRSVAETDILNIIRSMTDKVIVGDKTLIKPKEIDIYIPEKKLAIEFDGLYWHSNQMLYDRPNYHLEKTIECAKQGIQLIHIFEDEWQYKQDIVISRLKNIFGCYDNVIYARKCQVKEVSFEECKIFLNDNHIQGSCNSSYRYGLYYNNELISVMTFGGYRRSLGRQSVDNEYELLRFCCKLGYHIPGAASKLFHTFISKHNPIKVISYADRRWSNGKLYKAIGFHFVDNSKPNYWYVIGGKRQHRFAWRKGVLKEKLKVFDENKTEYQNMLDNGIDCVYDCGNMLFEWVKPN